MTARGKGKRADYILYYKPNIPVAIIEAIDTMGAAGSKADTFGAESRGGRGGRFSGNDVSEMKAQRWVRI